MTMRSNPVIYLHIEPADKQALTKAANKKGLHLITYCRMVLKDSLRGK